MSKFYESFMNQYKTEKTASAQTAANGLQRFSAEELEKLASEIAETFEGKEESKVKEDEEKKDKDKEKEAECSEESKSEEKDKEKEAECSSEDKKDEEKEAECSSEDKKDEEDKEAEDEEDSEEDKEAEDEEDSEEDKEASFSDDELEKMAFEFSEQKLAENGLGVIDYVYEKVANEEIACFITENAEKLAYLTDQPVLKVANDIVNSIFEKIN